MSNQTGLMVENQYFGVDGAGLLSIASVFSQIAASLEKNLLPRLSSSPPDIESLRLYLTLPECPLFTDQNNYVTITIPFAKSIVSLKDAALKVLGRLKTASWAH